MAKILLIEDEDGMVKALRDAFEYNGYSVSVAQDGETGCARAEAEQPDAIVLDVMLPGMDGFEVCRLLRKNNVSAPIIMLTARSEEVDKVVGLEVGADDYVTKPFSTRELLARVKAHLRRTAGSPRPSAQISFGSVVVDFSRHKATKAGKPVDLTSTEFSLLQLLVQRRGEVVTREEILNAVWGYETYPDSRTVDNHILNLRQKLEENPSSPDHILTVHGRGYKFVSD